MPKLSKMSYSKDLNQLDLFADNEPPEHLMRESGQQYRIRVGEKIVGWTYSLMVLCKPGEVMEEFVEGTGWMEV
jgi:hypothetical protein